MFQLLLRRIDSMSIRTRLLLPMLLLGAAVVIGFVSLVFLAHTFTLATK